MERLDIEHINENMPEVDPANAEIVAEVRKTLAKMNDYLYGQEPGQFLDLMDESTREELIGKYGRERLEDVADCMIRRGPRPILTELSEKFTKLLQDFNERYLQWWLLDGVRVEVVDVAGFLREEQHRGWVIQIPVSSEPIMVARLIDEMILFKVGRHCWDCYLRESNRVFLAGAPMRVDPDKRHLSAEEFIGHATREPMTEMEHDAQLRQASLAARSEVQN